MLLAATVLATSIATPAVADDRLEHDRDRLLTMVNTFRLNHGIARLDERAGLSDDAQRHSWRMANQRRLFHSTDLYRTVSSYDPRAWGENVGYGGTIGDVLRAWTRSPGHRANLLDSRFHRTGIGIVRSGGRYWITMIYYG